jgi:hypothetical protein
MRLKFKGSRGCVEMRLQRRSSMDINHHTSKTTFYGCDAVQYDKWLPRLLGNQLLSFYILKMNASCFTQNVGIYNF